MKRILSVILMACMMLTLLTGCTNDAKIASDFKNDFQQDGKFIIHGLKKGMSENEVLKKEHIKKSDLKTPILCSESSLKGDYYIDTKENLYGIDIDGKVRREYVFDDKGKYIGNSTIYLYFDSEQKYLKGCKKIGKLLHEAFGDPYRVNDKIKYNKKQAWEKFMNPPKFATWDDYMNANAYLTFEWGNSSKKSHLEVLQGPNLDFKSDFHNSYYIELFNSSFNE